MSRWFLFLHVAFVLMSASRDEFLVLPVSLGDASDFNQRIFPLSFHKRDNLGRGDLYLEATLGEMYKIQNIGTNAQQWASEVLKTTKARYDQLVLQRAELERLTRSNLNPFRAFANYRTARMFLAASRSLYVATRSRSEEMARTINRGLLSVPGKDVERAANDLPQGTNISGIAVKLDHPLDEDTRQQIATAVYTMATSSGSSEIQDDQTTSAASTLDAYVLAPEWPGDSETDEYLDLSSSPHPSSSRVTNNYYFHGSIYSPNSSIHGATVQQGGSGNSGSVNHNMRPPGN